MLFLAFLAINQPHGSKAVASSERGSLSQAAIIEEFKKARTGHLCGRLGPPERLLCGGLDRGGRRTGRESVASGGIDLPI
jgi:hypothetical protein